MNITIHTLAAELESTQGINFDIALHYINQVVKHLNDSDSQGITPLYLEEKSINLIRSYVLEALEEHGVQSSLQEEDNTIENSVVSCNYFKSLYERAIEERNDIIVREFSSGESAIIIAEKAHITRAMVYKINKENDNSQERASS